MALGLLAGLFAQDVPMLIVSRLLQGMAIGAGVTTAIAALGDLTPRGKDHGFAALVTTLATVFGLAGGPLVAGMFAQFAPWPKIVPYAVRANAVGFANATYAFLAPIAVLCLSGIVWIARSKEPALGV